MLELSVLFLETNVPDSVHGAVEEALAVQTRKVMHFVLGQELTEIVHLDAELGNLPLDLSNTGFFAVYCPDILAIPVKLAEDHDILLVGVEQLHLDSGDLLTNTDKVHNTCGSSKDRWLTSKTEADAIDNG